MKRDTLLGCSALPLVVLLAFVAFRVDGGESVRAAIEAHRKSPSQVTAHKLCELMNRRLVSAKEGEEILRLLCTPQTHVRASYSNKKLAYYALTRPHHIDFQENKLRRSVEYLFQGKVIHGGSSAGGDSLSAGTSFETVNPGYGDYAAFLDKQVGKAGTVEVTVRKKVEVLPPRATERRDTAVYSCEIETKVSLKFVGHGEEEKVSLLSDPSLDKDVKAAFSVVKNRWGTSRDDAKLEGEFVIQYVSLPAHVSFESVFEGNKGLKVKFVPEEPSLLTARRGERGKLFPCGGERRVITGKLTPGLKKGILVLKSSLKNAEHDPRIKAIWGGTLTYPYSFKVSEREKH